MGMAFFFGGIPRVEQFFNITVAQTASSMLALAVGSLIIPTAFHSWSGGMSNVHIPAMNVSDADFLLLAGERGIKELSRGTSIILLIVYGSYLFFQLKTHSVMYNAPSRKAERRSKGKSEVAAGIPHVDHVGDSSSGRSEEDAGIIVAEDEPEEPQLRRPAAIILLAVATALVALCAEFMVSSMSVSLDFRLACFTDTLQRCSYRSCSYFQNFRWSNSPPYRRKCGRACHSSHCRMQRQDGLSHWRCYRLQHADCAIGAPAQRYPWLDSP